MIDEKTIDNVKKTLHDWNDIEDDITSLTKDLNKLLENDKEFQVLLESKKELLQKIEEYKECKYTKIVNDILQNKNAKKAYKEYLEQVIDLNGSMITALFKDFSRKLKDKAAIVDILPEPWINLGFNDVNNIYATSIKNK